MDNRIPDNLKFLLQKYVQLLHAELGDPVYGIYIYGSLALNSYVENKSNIDFLTIVDKTLTGDDISRIQSVHKALTRYSPLANSMEGEYVCLRDINNGKPDKRYPYFAYGKYQGDVCIKNFDWFQLKLSGITIDGNDFNKVSGEVNWPMVKRELGKGLNEHWLKTADKNYILLFDEWISLIVLTLCRIYYTLENQMVISKSGGGKYAIETVDPEWHTLIKEALRIHYKSGNESLYRSKLKRKKNTKEFIRYMTNLCNDKYRLEYL